MGKSILRNKFMKSLYKGHYLAWSKRHLPVRNPHRQDEMLKNSPSRLVTTHCGACVHWLQEPTSFGGHSIPWGGHRRVSGLVRASLKREARKVIGEQLMECQPLWDVEP